MVYLSSATSFPVVGADFVSPVVKACTAALSCLLARGARLAGRVSSAGQLTFWGAASGCWGFTFGAVGSGGELMAEESMLQS